MQAKRPIPADFGLLPIGKLLVFGGAVAVLLCAVIPYQVPIYLLQIFAISTCSYISIFSSSHHQDGVDIPHENENNGETTKTMARR